MFINTNRFKTLIVTNFYYSFTSNMVIYRCRLMEVYCEKQFHFNLQISLNIASEKVVTKMAHIFFQFLYQSDGYATKMINEL